jgi:hypothetical protein
MSNADTTSPGSGTGHNAREGSCTDCPSGELTGIHWPADPDGFDPQPLELDGCSVALNVLPVDVGSPARIDLAVLEADEDRVAPRSPQRACR